MLEELEELLIKLSNIPKEHKLMSVREIAGLTRDHALCILQNLTPVIPEAFGKYFLEDQGFNMGQVTIRVGDDEVITISEVYYTLRIGRDPCWVALFNYG